MRAIQNFGQLMVIVPEFHCLLYRYYDAWENVGETYEASDIYVWYYDVSYLPRLISKASLKCEVRHYKLYTEKVNVYGKEMVAVH
jgi:hypothetical protein